eukprot:1079573-Pelagomonas_calceolata.AAC.13
MVVRLCRAYICQAHARARPARAQQQAGRWSNVLQEKRSLGEPKSELIDWEMLQKVLEAPVVATTRCKAQRKQPQKCLT